MKKQLQNEVDIVGLIVKIQEQIAALDRKVDILISKSLSRPIETRPVPKPSFQPPVNAHDPVPGSTRPNDHHRARQMHQATCADCKKECEIPFKPNGDRPVYCKECFTSRKSGNISKAVIDNKPKETLPAPVIMNAPITVQEPPVKEKKKSSVAKKSVGKKKPVLAKKKK